MSGVGQRKAGGGARSWIGKARRKTRSAQRARPFKWLVRAGFLGRGVTYGLIGALALAMAAGAGTMGTSASQQGALALIAEGWLGKLALVVIAAGLLAYAAWKLSQGILGQGPEGGGGSSTFERWANAAGGVAYVVFFSVAVQVLIGGGGSSSGGGQHAAAGVLGWPGGPVLVALGGAVLIGVSLYQIYEGLSGHFAEEEKTQKMGHKERHLFLTLGRVGLTVRALVFLLIGYFLVRTAFDYSSSQAVGVDAALARLHHQTLGPWLVGLVGVGLLVFALFSFFEARFRRL